MTIAKKRFTGSIDRRAALQLIVGVPVVAASALLSGCQRTACFPFLKRPEQVVYSPIHRDDCQLLGGQKLREYWPRRVALIESGQNKGHYDQNQIMIAELATQFRDRQFFDVVSPCDQRLFGHPDNLVHGKFEEREVVGIARQYNADTLALVRVNELRSHQPLRTSVTVAFINAAQTIVTGSVTGVWDLAKLETAAAFEEFVFGASHGVSNSINSQEAVQIQLQSPRNLMRFVAADIAQALA